ncbi:hypothetical protein DOY81_015404, partial [Sarcophaga bullata]
MPVLLTNENKTQLLQEAKNNLWSNMRQIFSNIPNFLIFNTIMRLKEDQLQHVMSLNKTNITNDSHMTTSTHSREPLTNFEINLMKTKSYFLSLVGKYLSACQERKRLEEQYVQAFNEFEDKLLDKVKIFNADTDTEQNEAIMRNYVMEYYSLHFNKGENEFIAQQIEMIKAEIENTTKHLENHEVLIGSLKQVYNEINTSVNRLQYEIKQLSQIKDKIIYSKVIMKRQLDDLEATTNVKSNFMPTKL